MDRATRANVLQIVITVYLCFTATCHVSRDIQYKNWESYQGDPGRNQYSSLAQINKTNVEQLQVAWIYHTGGVWGERSQIQCNPIIVDGVLYGTSPNITLFALRATTGELLWKYDPELDFSPHVNRGVAYWKKGNDRRILFTAALCFSP